jgi:hypothetical protein
VVSATPPGAATNVTAADLIACPSLQRILRLAKAEWAG